LRQVGDLFEFNVKLRWQKVNRPRQVIPKVQYKLKLPLDEILQTFIYKYYYTIF